MTDQEERNFSKHLLQPLGRLAEYFQAATFEQNSLKINTVTIQPLWEVILSTELRH